MWRQKRSVHGKKISPVFPSKTQNLARTWPRTWPGYLWLIQYKIFIELSLFLFNTLIIENTWFTYDT